MAPGVNVRHPPADRAAAHQRHLGDDGGAAHRRGEVEALATQLRTETRAAIGLHVTLTAPFAPLSAGFAPMRDGLPADQPMMRLATRG